MKFIIFQIIKNWNYFYIYIFRRIIRVSMFVRNLYEPLNYDIRKLNSLRHDENPWHDTRAMKHRHVLPWAWPLRWPASPPSNIRLSRWTGWWSSWEPEATSQIPYFLYITPPFSPFFFQSHVIRNPSPSFPLNFHQRFVAIKVHTIDKKNYQLIIINKYFQRWEGKKQRRWWR